MKSAGVDMLELLNLLYFYTFVFFTVLGFVRIAVRAYEYRSQRLPLPALLPRDLGLFGGLALPFVGVLFFRAAGIDVSEEWWYPVWVFISGGAAVLGVGWWVWYEYFRVERPPR